MGMAKRTGCPDIRDPDSPKHDAHQKGGNAMDKTEVSQTGIPRQETVQPIPEDEREIIRETHPDGTIVYRNAISCSHEEIGTMPLTVQDIFMSHLQRLGSLANMMHDEHYNEIGFLIEGFTRDTERQVEEMCKFMDEAIGEICFDIITQSNWPYRTGRVVGVTLKPPKEVAHDTE